MEELLSELPQSEITHRSILETLNLHPRRICFASTHANALRRSTNPEYWGSFSVPFEDTIGPLFERETGLRLFPSKNSPGFWHSLQSEDSWSRVEEFVNEFRDLVFLRDGLDLSLSLGENFGESERTHIGMLEYFAKYRNDQKAFEELAIVAHKLIRRLPFYQNADGICSIPSSNPNQTSLPQKIANNITDDKIIDYSTSVLWKNAKPELKGVSLPEKLTILEETGLNVDSSLHGKSIILLDDLYQSGVTMQFVAMKMKEMGVARVFGLSLVKSRKNSDNL